jgi:hypothetical protein
LTVPGVGGREQRRKPQPPFCVGVKLRRNSDILVGVLVSFFLFTLRMLEVLSLEAVWNFVKGTGLP